MTHITEIIRDDMPDWARKAMEEGQFFNVCCEKFKQLDKSCKGATTASVSLSKDSSGNSELLDALEQLANEWSTEGGFLDNPHDTKRDRACGRIYKECADQLASTIKALTHTD